jgi:hypothetical protein
MISTSKLGILEIKSPLFFTICRAREIFLYVLNSCEILQVLPTYFISLIIT